MVGKFFIIKEVKKDNKLISIFRDDKGNHYLKKQLINKNDIDMLLTLKNEVLCFKILKSTNIVPKIVEYDLNNDKPYIVMEYLNFSRLDLVRFSSLKEKVVCMLNILSAVEVLHNNGIIHCDLKPQNIFIDKKFNIRIIDFGISSINGQRSLINYGSLNYCSPEQIEGKKINIQADIFSLGIIFYKILTGNYPFIREKSNLKCEMKYYNIQKVQDEKLNDIFFKAINENPEFRYKTIADFRNELMSFLEKREG